MRTIPALLVGASALLTTARASAQWAPAAENKVEPTPMVPDAEARPALASDRERPTFVDDQSPHAGEWYGWETLIGLAVSDAVALVGVGMAAKGSGAGAGFIVVGATGHVLTGPIVHFSRGHVGRGFAAFGLTLGVAALTSLAGLGIGASTDRNCRSFCFGTPIGAVFGAMGGGIIGPFIDVGALSYEPDARHRTSLVLRPLFSNHQTGVALGGTF